MLTHIIHHHQHHQYHLDNLFKGFCQPVKIVRVRGKPKKPGFPQACVRKLLFFLAPS